MTEITSLTNSPVRLWKISNSADVVFMNFTRGIFSSKTLVSILNMRHYTMLPKYDNCTRLLKIKNKLKIGCFPNKVGKNSRYFVGVFNKTIIPLALVGFEMILANSALRASLAIYHLISNAPSWNNC